MKCTGICFIKIASLRACNVVNLINTEFVISFDSYCRVLLLLKFTRASYYCCRELTWNYISFYFEAYYYCVYPNPILVAIMKLNRVIYSLRILFMIMIIMMLLFNKIITATFYFRAMTTTDKKQTNIFCHFLEKV